VVLPDVARERRRTLENVLEAVAHEVRNPLMAIGGFAQRMARNLSGNGDVRRYAHIIAEESSRLERALNEAFEFLRDTELEFVPRDVTSMLEESVAHIAVLLEEKRIDLEFDDGRIPQLAMVDDLALRKAFQHLLMLLVRLTPADAGKIAIRMDFSAAGHELVIILRGDGARMPADLHAMLTGLDFSGKHFGSGFAALFARKTLESHQGRLEVHGGEDHVELAIFLPLLPRHRH
jgi:signal transduction histidine kinase